MRNLGYTRQFLTFCFVPLHMTITITIRIKIMPRRPLVTPANIGTETVLDVCGQSELSPHGLYPLQTRVWSTHLLLVHSYSSNRHGAKMKWKQTRSSFKKENKRRLIAENFWHFFYNIIIEVLKTKPKFYTRNFDSDSFLVKVYEADTVDSLYLEFKGLAEILRDIRTSTYQICRFEEKLIRTTTFNKYICNWTHEV